MLDGISPESIVRADFARKLERERDEAREELINLRVENDHNWQANADLEEMIKLARELRDALAIALRQWRTNAEMNGADRDFDNENTMESQWFDAQHKVLTKAKEVLP